MSDEPAHQDQHASPIETALKLEVVEYLPEDGPNHHPHADGGFTGSEYCRIIFGETDGNHGEHYMYVLKKWYLLPETWMQVLPKPCKNLINTEHSKNMSLKTIKILPLLRVIHSIDDSKAKAANDKAEVS